VEGWEEVEERRSEWWQDKDSKGGGRGRLCRKRKHTKGRREDPGGGRCSWMETRVEVIWWEEMWVEELHFMSQSLERRMEGASKG